MLYDKVITIIDKSKKIRCQFSDNLSKFEKTQASLFQTIKPNVEKLRQRVIKDDIIHFTNFPLFKCLSINEVKQILQFQFSHIMSILPIPSYEICSDKIKKLDGEFSYQFNPIDPIFWNCISIGSNEIIGSLEKQDDSNNIDWYQNYHNILQYHLQLEDIPKNIHLNISSITISMIYSGKKSTHRSIDIVKLFNINNVGKMISKIFIHSTLLDDFNNNVREIQYVKSSKMVKNVFKGIAQMYNTCGFYFGSIVDKQLGIIFHHLEVQTDMTINFVFINTNINNTYETIQKALKNYIDTMAIKIFKFIYLEETIYSFDFSYDLYIPIFNGISTSITVYKAKQDDIDNLSQLLAQEIPNMKFTTRSSTQMNSYGFLSVGSIYKLFYLNNSHSVITQQILYKDFLPTLHCGFNGATDVNVSILNAFSIEDCMFAYKLVLGIFNKYELHQMEKSLNIESIRKNAMGYGKKLLKVLEQVDPELFGQRVIGHTKRTFSGLCQKTQQRVVPITIEEYEYLKKQVSQSVISIQNQTYPDQRLYLFCPYKSFSFLNFHWFPNQKCIIRCTSKSSNKQQYNLCSKALNADNIIIENKYENQSITMYNPIISKGRRCLLPDELQFVILKYILIKLELSGMEKLREYCKSLNAEPFIIKRNENKQRYEIITEYSISVKEYILILQSEIIDTEFFMFIKNDKEIPLKLNDNQEFKRFILSNIKRTVEHFTFFDFIERIIGIQLNNRNETFAELIEYLKKSIKLVTHRNFIYGFIWKNEFYSSPMIWYDRNEEDYIKILNEKHYPSIDKFDIKYITEIYLDYNDDLVKVIKYLGVFIAIKPITITAKYQSIEQIIFDYKAYHESKIKIGATRKIPIQFGRYYGIDLIVQYFFIYYLSNIDFKNINKMFVKTPDAFVFLDENKRIVSWKHTKLNEKHLSGLTFDNRTIISMIYNKLQTEMRFNTRVSEIISEKIITI
jgi:hypothetical protein